MNQIKSDFIIQMNKDGYNLITNFDVDDSCEITLIEASNRCGIDYKIITEAYNMRGNILPRHKAFYAHKKHSNLSDFWKAVREIRDK